MSCDRAGLERDAIGGWISAKVSFEFSCIGVDLRDATIVTRDGHIQPMTKTFFHVIRPPRGGDAPQRSQGFEIDDSYGVGGRA